MNVLVTGCQGGIGQVLVKKLLESGHSVCGFDRQANRKQSDYEYIPGDIRDIASVRKIVSGMDAVVHLAAILTDTLNDQELIYSVNIQGTWNILMACVEAGIPRLVNFSSIQALGHSNPIHSSIYFPLNDRVPKEPASPYQISKHVAEEMCQAFTIQARNVCHQDLSIISLRPTFVFQPDAFRKNAGHRLGWKTLPIEQLILFGKKDYWSFVHVEDVCQAASLALTAPITGHQAFLLTSDFTWVTNPTQELVDRYYPHFSWKGTTPQQYFQDNAFRSLIDCTPAKDILGWNPQFSQREIFFAELERMVPDE